MSTTQDSSLGGGSFVSPAQNTFDVRHEGDVINLMRFIHLNPIDPEIKNHLRDLIFSYRQSLSPEDGQKIEQNFKALGIVVVYKDAEQPTIASVPQAKGLLGSSRPMPRFAPVSVSSAQSVRKAEQVSAESTLASQQPAPAITPPQEVKDQGPIPAVPPQEHPHAADRIKEIKRTINEKIGNPINLIESHGELGREYMNALLDAMKKSNGAPLGELDAAMVRLEKAFVAVEAASNVPTNSAPHPHASPAATPVPPKAEVLPEAESITHASPEVSRPVASPRLTISSETAPTVSRMSSVRENLSSSASPLPLKEVIGQAPVATPPVSPTVAPEESSLHSVAKEKQLQDLLRRSKHHEAVSAKESAESLVAHTDPLMTPQVSAGLQQLLSEWSLFKSSGIFGTGPNGDDHPLYKKIGGLTMAAVIAGRFEGATPAIKQSITDYMNGWRYEEGIVHEHTETFEHYLRKVVRHILNKKQK